MTTTSGPAWWASAFGTIIDGAGAVWVPAGCYDLCTLFKADSDFGSCSWWCRILLTYLSLKFERWVERRRCRAACVCVVGVVDDIRPCPRHDATASRPEIEQPNLAPPSARGCRVCSGCPAVREFARSLVRSLVLLRSGIQPCVHPPLHAGRKLTFRIYCMQILKMHNLTQNYRIKSRCT